MAADDEPAIDATAAALRIGDARGDHGVGVLAPDLVLRPLVVEREHPVMDGEVRDVPPRGGASARDLGGDVEEPDEGQFHATPASGLMEAQEAGAMEILERLLRHLPGDLRPCRTLAQHRHQGRRPAHGLVVVHVDEAAPGALALVHARAPAVWGIIE